MTGKFVVFVLFLSVVNCKCGLISWFNEWGDELNTKNAIRKCREKRETGEDGIKSDIGQPAANKVVSLIDIENERKLPNEMEEESPAGGRENVKTKRCHPDNLVGSIHNPKQNKLSNRLKNKRGTDDVKLYIQLCLGCRKYYYCYPSEPCDICKVFCKHVSLNDEPNDLSPTMEVASRSSSTTDDDIFSKTLYPVTTFRGGDTKEVICQLVGIKDTSNIETVTIWVTTFTNEPPKIRHGDQPVSDLTGNERDEVGRNSKGGIKEDNVDASKVAATESYKDSPKMQSRFSERDDDEDIFSSTNDADDSEGMRKNPDVIEGPPPILGEKNRIGSNKEDPVDNNAGQDKLIVQPKEFETDDYVDDNFNNQDRSNNEFSTDNKIPEIVKPSKSRKLKLKKLNRKRPMEDMPKYVAARSGVNSEFSPSADSDENTKNTKNDGTNGKLGDSNPLKEINEAIKEVKSLVQKMQDKPLDELKDGILRLPQSASQTRDLLHPAVPVHVMDNLNKVNQYLKNRAQDVLDAIKDNDPKLGESPQSSVRQSTPDEHSELAKDVISNLKKMPQFVLDRVQDSLSNFDKGKKEVNIQESKIESDTESSQDMQIQSRFSDNTQEPDNKNEDDEVGMPHTLTENTNKVDEMVTDPNVALEPPTTKFFKTKYDKYLADLKAKRQKLHSPEKFKTRKVENPLFNEVIDTSPIQNLLQPKPGKFNLLQRNAEDNVEKPVSKIIDNINKQKESLKDKVKAIVEEAKLKNAAKISPAKILPSSTIGDDTVGSRPNNDLPNLDNGQTVIPQIGNRNKDYITSINGNTEMPNQLSKYIDRLRSKLQPKVSLDKPDLQRAANKLELDKDQTKPRLAQYLDDLQNKMNKAKSADITEDTEEFLKKLQTKYPKMVTAPMQFPYNLAQGRSSLPDNSNLEEIINPTSTANILSSRFGEDTTDPVTVKNNWNKNKDAKKAALKDRLNEYLYKLNRPIGSTRYKVMPKERIPLLTSRFDKNPVINGEDPKLNLAVDEMPRQWEVVQSDDKKTAVEPKTSIIIGAKAPDMQEEGEENKEFALESRSNFNDDDSDSSWSSNLGKIISGTTNANEVYFMGNGIKLPMKMDRKEDGSLDLSVDLEKLCSCNNSTCPKNSAAIEETVGAILEKEAELQDQLKISHGSTGEHDTPNIFSRNSFNSLDSPSSSKDFNSQHSKHSFKRSPDLTNFVNEEKITQSPLKAPVFSGLQTILKDLANLGKQLQNSFTKTAHQIEDNIDSANKKLLSNVDRNKLIDISNSITTQSSLKGINSNDPTNLQDYLDRLNSKLLKQNEIKSIPERQNENVYLPKLSSMSPAPTPIMQQVLAKTPQNKLLDLNNNLQAIQDSYQNVQVSSLQKKLNDLDDQVEKFYENNENMIIKEGQKLFSGLKNHNVDKEVNIIKKVLSWMKDLPPKSNN